MLLIQKYPTKYVYLIVIFLYTLSNSLTPLFAQHLGYQATFVVRFLMGMSDGFVTPSINTFISQWFPVNERSTALGLNAIGEQLAGVTESPLAALFCQSSFGWPAVFYVAGISGTIWCTIWLFAGSSNPYECRKITEKERNYLLSANGSNLKKQTTISWRNVPFKAIFTSIPFLAQLQCHFLMCFSSALLETYLPTYFKEVLLLGVITNGLYISLPNFFNLLGKVVWGIGFDHLKQNDILTPTASAKFSQAVSSYGMAISFICLALFVDCSNRTLALIICCFLFAFQGIECSGFVTSLLSLAPRYTASLSSISLFTAQLGALATPYIVSAYQTKDVTHWKALFLTSSAICMISGTIFIIFGSGEVQPWALEERESTANLSESETETGTGTNSETAA
ncbi:hypothetical protein WR25_16772 isoform A [Diploscapter pachys]|uniref:Major facilitator superfamily (MFS) profile domain-containing protein n=1 Tax=Diploscapter pachys TaxID=2018661 RepID=A0A2A2L866_9BILA|nr:hypothetical protein WR25_16772 isoform A [Diploscapter pachys]